MSAGRRRGHQEVWALTPGGVSREQSSAVTCTCGGLGTSLGGPGGGTVAEPRCPSSKGGGEGPSPEQEEQLWGGERRAAGPCSARAGGTQERTGDRESLRFPGMPPRVRTQWSSSGCCPPPPIPRPLGLNGSHAAAVDLQGKPTRNLQGRVSWGLFMWGPGGLPTQHKYVESGWWERARSKITDCTQTENLTVTSHSPAPVCLGGGCWSPHFVGS